MVPCVFYVLLFGYSIGVLAFPTTNRPENVSKEKTEVDKIRKMLEGIQDHNVREDLLIQMYLTEKAEVATLNQAIGGLKNGTEQVTADAELAEFLLFTREGLATFEEQASRNMIGDTNLFAEEVSKKTKIPKAELTGKKHFRKWMHILVFGNAEKFNSIEKLRAALNHDYKRYMWFASQMQNVFDVFCGDVYGKSPLEIRYMKRAKFRKYVRFFTGEIRTAIVTFLESVY